MIRPVLLLWKSLLLFIAGALLSVSAANSAYAQASQAQMTIDGKPFPIYDVTGGDITADIVSDVRPTALNGRKHINQFHWKPIHFKIDLEGFDALRPWIETFLTQTPTPKDGTVDYRERRLTFTHAFATLISFPSGIAGDSGLIDVEITAEQIRVAANTAKASRAHTPTPFTTGSVTVETLVNPIMEALNNRPTLKLAVTTEQAAGKVEPTLTATTFDLSDLNVTQSTVKSGGLADWVTTFFFLGNHLDTDEKTVKVTYFRGGMPAFALAFGHCGLKDVQQNFNVDPIIQATLYAETVGLEAPAANAAPPKDSPPVASKLEQALPPTENGVFGQAYLDSADKSIGVNVVSAEYRGDRFLSGITPQTANIALLGSNEKFVVLTVRVTNLSDADIPVGFDKLHFSVEDDKNVKILGSASAFRASDQLDYNAPLAAGKSIDLQLYGVMSGPAQAKRLKIWADDPAVATGYDLDKNIVRALPPILAVAGSPGGSQMLENVEAQTGTWYPTGYFDVRFDSLSVTEKPVEGSAPDAGQEYILIHARFRNAYRSEHQLAFETFRFVGFDKAGHRFECREPLEESLKGTGQRTFQPAGKDGSEFALVYFFAVPKGTHLTHLTFQEASGHLFVVTPK